MKTSLYFLDRNFWLSPSLVITLTLTLFAIVFGRYLFTALVYQYFINKKTKQKKSHKQQQLYKEIRWSLISSLIFAVLSVGCFYLYQQGFTRVYTDITERSISYFVFSIVLLLVLYETYYYWLHRWMHKPEVFKIVHKVHHESIHSSVFTSFSFHPLEALLQFIFLPAMVLIIPIHYYALGIVLMLMTVSAVINHAGYEIFPKGFHKHRIGKWLIGSTHHDLHHKEFKSNYGLYLTFWDRWMKTESKNYSAKFEENTGINQSQSQHHL